MAVTLMARVCVCVHESKAQYSHANTVQVCCLRVKSLCSLQKPALTSHIRSHSHSHNTVTRADHIDILHVQQTSTPAIATLLYKHTPSVFFSAYLEPKSYRLSMFVCRSPGYGGTPMISAAGNSQRPPRS